MLTTYLHQCLHTFIFLGKWYVICLVIFVPLALFFPDKQSQPLLRRDMTTDTLYWFLAPIFHSAVYKFVLILLVTSIYSSSTIQLLATKGKLPFSVLPLWLQALILLLITDFLQYWVHRLFHHTSLWKLHAVHHASEHVDWLSAARFHPVNFIIYVSMIDAVVFLLGFNPAAYMMLLPFYMLYPSFVHANLNWTFGPFRYLLASPVFHRWHHTSAEEGGNKNFAPTFPFFDVIFGTYYEPENRRPVNFGAQRDTVPNNFIGQLFYPFS